MARCFNYGKLAHLKKDCRQGVPRNSVFLEIIKTVGPSFLEYAEGMAKAALD